MTAALRMADVLLIQVRDGARSFDKVSSRIVLVYATFACLMHAISSTPLAFEQPGSAVLDVKLPWPFASKRLPALGPVMDSNGFGDRGTAMLLDDNIGAVAPTYPRPQPRSNFVPGKTTADVGVTTVSFSRSGTTPSSLVIAVDYSHEINEAIDEVVPAGEAFASSNSSEVPFAHMPRTSDTTLAAEGKGQTIATYSLKSYIDRKVMKHQRVVSIKTKVKELLKHNSTSSLSMQPVSTAEIATVSDYVTALVNHGSPMADSSPSPLCCDNSEKAAKNIAAYRWSSESSQATASYSTTAQAAEELSAADKNYQTLYAAIERLQLAPSCTQYHTGVSQDDISTQIYFSLGVALVTTNKILAATLHVYFRGKAAEQIPSAAEDRLTVLLQQNVLSVRQPTLPGARRSRRIVGHHRVMATHAGYVTFNVAKVLSSWMENSSGRNRWFTLSVINPMGYLLNSRDFFYFDDCNVRDILGDHTISITSDSPVDGVSRIGRHEVKSHEMAENSEADSTLHSEQASPKPYMDITLLKKH